MQQQMLEWVMQSALMEKFILLQDILRLATMLVKVIWGQFWSQLNKTYSGMYDLNVPRCIAPECERAPAACTELSLLLFIAILLVKLF